MYQGQSRTFSGPRFQRIYERIMDIMRGIQQQEIAPEAASRPAAAIRN